MSAARARAQRVLRCECGQFVRLDRAFAEERSHPAHAAPPDSDLADAFDDEETHMFASLEDIAALGSAPKAAAVRTSTYDEDDGATRVASSPVHLSRRSSIPPPRRPSSPVQRAVTPAPPEVDKPLWYVDLGGAETVEMTIEQLIIARRSGKLGEGALVWRAGMPDWRPVGSLIPATGSNPSHASVPPPAPVRAKQPTPQTLGTYERPAATLEFALEKAETASSPRAPSSANLRPSSRPPPPRAPTPIPKTALPGPTRASQVGPLPAPAPLPPRGASGLLPAPMPQPTPTPAERPTSSIPLTLGRSSPLPPPRSTPPLAAAVAALYRYPWHGPRPRWLSVGIAVFICIAASGSGAFVVRALKIRRQPLSLATTQLSAAPAPVALAAPQSAPQPAEPAAAASTEVVDIDSLSVEHRAPRAQARPPAWVAPATLGAPPNADNAAPGDDAPPAPAPAPQAAPRKPRNDDLPSAAHSNPYTTGSLSDGASPSKKPAPSNSDNPGF